MSNLIYKPKIGKISSADCLKLEKFDALCKEVTSDETLSLSDQRFLKLLATRFIIFKYEKLADYYANTNLTMKNWLEKLNCVIIDDDKAIERGYFKYLDEYGELLGSIVNEK